MIESRSLSTGEERETLIEERIVSGATFTVLTHTVEADGAVSYSQVESVMDGTPVSCVQEGEWSDRWNRFETSFEKDSQKQDINGMVKVNREPSAVFRNPSALWFWKTHPKKGESVLVTFLAQNVLTKFQIRYTYEADEEMALAGRKVNVHRVREDPIGAKGVYTLWWYDDRGMGVKRYHKTTQHEYWYELKAWR